MDRGAWWATVRGVAAVVSLETPSRARAHSVMSDTLRPHGLQPTRLLCPWDFPGKNTGVPSPRAWRPDFPGAARAQEVATHSSILAWEIPWTEEPGGIQSMALQSQTHLATQQRTAAQVEQSHYITPRKAGADGGRRRPRGDLPLP